MTETPDELADQQPGGLDGEDSSGGLSGEESAGGMADDPTSGQTGAGLPGEEDPDEEDRGEMSGEPAA